MADKLRLKFIAGWFPIHESVMVLLGRLRDSAFKLCIFILVLADRHTGTLRMSIEDLSAQVGTPVAALMNDLATLKQYGVLTIADAVITISDDYWPYTRRINQPPANLHREQYVGAILDYMKRWSCIGVDAIRHSRKLAEQLFEKSVPREQLEHAILLGCSRKYMQISKNGEAPDIGNLAYFVTLLDEAKITTDTSYWNHLEQRLTELERRADSPRRRAAGAGPP